MNIPSSIFKLRGYQWFRSWKNLNFIPWNFKTIIAIILLYLLEPCKSWCDCVLKSKGTLKSNILTNMDTVVTRRAWYYDRRLWPKILNTLDFNWVLDCAILVTNTACIVSIIRRPIILKIWCWYYPSRWGEDLFNTLNM